MYKYDGQVVYEVHDDEGIIEVVDTKRERALHFGSSARQSSMLLDEPERLNSLYAKSMMAVLLFNANPSNILMIGLGGGTLAKFLLRQFPECQIKVIEFRKTVLKVARSHFNLPFDARLKVKIGCGGHHVLIASRESESRYDLMMVDAYHHDGMADEVSSELFFDNCRTLLSEEGILVINLWGTDKLAFESVSWNMEKIFEGKILFLPVRKRGNIIGLAFKNFPPKQSLKWYQEKATELEHLYALDFSLFLLDLKRRNNNRFNQVIQT